jgi:hypothetical protein
VHCYDKDIVWNFEMNFKTELTAQLTTAVVLALCPPSALAEDPAVPTSETKPAEAAKVEAESSVEHIATEESPVFGRGLFKKLMNTAYFWRLRYYFVAQNAKNCTLFYGLIQDDPLIGRASVEFTFPDGCRCHGYAQVTHLPKGRGVVGQEGVIKTKCTDGRKVTGRFITTSLTTGTATVSDSNGNDYQATFGHTADQAVSSVNELRRKLGCPECNARDIEMKVQGKVLPSKE